MRPSKLFAELHHHVMHRLNKLQALASSACFDPFAEQDVAIAYVTIECQSTLANFVRSYYLSCTLTPVLENGRRVTCSPTVRTFNDAIDASMRKCKPTTWRKGGWDRRDEPPWHRPETLINSCQEIGCSHMDVILSAFSVSTGVFDHLTKFRNFYAHRNDYTVRFARLVASSYSISSQLHPTTILCSTAYSYT